MSKKPNYEFKNLTKSQQDCLSIIEGLGIYELRALARVFGDNSPTTLKRDEHIKIVMDKIISGEELRPLPLRQGRPHKELSSIQGILEELSILTGKDYNTNKNKSLGSIHLQKNIVFKQCEQDIIEKQLFPIKAKGILCENANGDLFFYNQYNFKFVLVGSDLRANLTTYDFVEGTAVLMNNDNEYILKSIEKINFKDVKTYKNETNPYKKTNPYQSLTLENNNFTLGNRYRINDLIKFADKKAEIAKLVSCLRQNSIITLAIIPNVPDEDLLDIQSIGFDSQILFKYNEKTLDPFNTLATVNEFLKRQQEIGNSVAIFVQDPVTLLNMIDYSLKNEPKCFMGHTEAASALIRDFGTLIMAGEGQKSTTCFFTFDNSDLFDPLYVSLIYKVYKPFDLK